MRILERLGRLLRRREHREDVRAGHAEPRDLRLDVVGADVVGLCRHDLDLGALEAAAEAREQLLAEAVVLVEDPHPRGALRACQVLPEDPGLGRVRRPQADRVGEAARVGAERGRTGRSEELRHLPLVEVVADREVLLRAERVEDREDAVLLDEPARLRGRAHRVGGVVPRDVLDAAAVHPAAGVDVVEVRLRAARDRGVGRLGPRQRRGAAEQDRRGGHAGVGGRPRGRGEGGGRPGGECEGEREQRENELPCHRVVVRAAREEKSRLRAGAMVDATC